MKGDPRHCSRILRILLIPNSLSVEFSGGSKGGPRAPPLLILDQTKKILETVPPRPHLSQGLDLDDRPPPLIFILILGLNPPLELHSVFQLLTGFRIPGLWS